MISILKYIEKIHKNAENLKELKVIVHEIEDDAKLTEGKKRKLIKICNKHMRKINDEIFE